MDILFTYILGLLLSSGLSLAYFRLVLYKRMMYRCCRYYLIITMLLSVAVPALNVPFYDANNLLFRHPFLLQVVEQTDETVVLRNGQVALAAIYFAIVLALFAVIVRNLLKLKKMRDSSFLSLDDGFMLAENDNIKTPFSFSDTVFIGKDYSKIEREQIILHEASHIKHRHSYERLVLSLLRSIFWFNPFFWKSEAYLAEVQEWEADSDVINAGYEIEAYRTTIFKQLFGYTPDLCCALNNSTTKNRFIMINNKKLSGSIWRLIAYIPMFALIVMIFGCTTTRTLDYNVNGDYVIEDADGELVQTYMVRTDEDIEVSLNDNDRIPAVLNGEDAIFEYYADYPLCYATSGFVQNNHLKVLGQPANLKGVLSSVKTRYALADSLKIGGMTIYNLLFVIIPGSQLRGPFIAEPGPILGRNFLEAVGDVKIDLNAGILTFPAKDMDIDANMEFINGVDLVRVAIDGEPASMRLNLGQTSCVYGSKGKSDKYGNLSIPVATTSGLVSNNVLIGLDGHNVKYDTIEFIRRRNDCKADESGKLALDFLKESDIQCFTFNLKKHYYYIR